MNWDESIWFFDVDDTLINTDELTAIGAEGTKSVFENNYWNSYKVTNLI